MKKRVLTVIGIAVFTLAAYAQWSNPANDIPAYNAAPPKGALPPIMAGQQLSGEYFSHPYQVKTYQMAAKVSPVLHQLPCYCHCDRSMGHNSLHSCFEGTHGAACSTCMKEAAFAYQQTRLGKTPAQIRAAIERGEWMNVDLEKASL
ncbi:CYCXC family (seleno)protein [Terriglobus sp. 2YAB30_2]|uniref:CYCXC family (seleno)protein n=2 Tax=unclassified Terriglobus TaxID=2628988 RepID=UPI003F9E7699